MTRNCGQCEAGQLSCRDLGLHQRHKDQAGHGKRHGKARHKLQTVLKTKFDPGESNARQQKNRRHNFEHCQ
jgi:hypothetical protein